MTTVGKYGSVIVIAMLLGYLTSRPKLMCFYDTTATKQRTLTPNSQNIVARMDGGLTMTTFVNILEENYWAGLPRSVNDDLRRFKMYTRFKPEIKMKYVYYYDKAKNPELDKAYPNLSDRERMLKRAEIWNLDSNMFMRPEEVRKIADLRPEGNRFVRLLERDNGEKTFLRIFDDIQRFPFETEISAAFKRLVMELPLVGFVKCIVLKKVYSKLSKPMSELNLPSVRRRYYPVKTKLSAVRDRVINEMGYAEVLSKYEVKPSTFHVWLHKYKSRVLSEEQHKRLSSRNYKMLYPMTDQERAELESLRQEVEKQKILVEAYELMLELARERLHVDVKKNYEEMLLAGLLRDRKNGEVKP